MVTTMTFVTGEGVIEGALETLDARVVATAGTTTEEAVLLEAEYTKTEYRDVDTVEDVGVTGVVELVGVEVCAVQSQCCSVDQNLLDMMYSSSLAIPQLYECF